MSGFDDDELVKIPYDQEPIVRASEFSGKGGGNKSSGGSNKILSVIVGLLLIVNVIMGAFIVKLYIKSNDPAVLNNPTYNISVDGTNTAWAAATKAKLSSVCVSAGLNSDTGTTINYNNFFNMSSRGSGTIIEIDKEKGNATILTCYHVIENYTSQVYILTYDSYTPIRATVVGYSSTYDIAVLKVEGNSEITSSSCIATTFSDSSVIAEGQMAIAIGNPLSMGFSVSVGVISAPVNLISIEGQISRVIKVDTPINSGNSGGGLFNDKGELIGVVNAKLMSSEIDNVAYAIPINLAKNLAYNIIENGNPTKAVLGLNLAILSDGNSIDNETGRLNSTIVVDSVNTLSPCYVAGIRSGDVLVSISYGETEVKITNLYDVEDNMFNLSVGDSVTITVNRSGVLHDYTFNITQTQAVL